MPTLSASMTLDQCFVQLKSASMLVDRTWRSIRHVDPLSPLGRAKDREILELLGGIAALTTALCEAFNSEVS